MKCGHHPPSRHAVLTAQKHPVAAGDAELTAVVATTAQRPAGVAAAAAVAGKHAGQSLDGLASSEAGG